MSVERDHLLGVVERRDPADVPRAVEPRADIERPSRPAPKDPELPADGTVTRTG